MFEILLSGFLDTLFSLLWWSWAHPDLAGLALSGTAFVMIVWLCVPPELVCYSQRDWRMAQRASGRLAVLLYCRQHDIDLALGRKIGQTLLEFFLKMAGIPNPCDFSWDGGFAASRAYPLGRSRQEYINLCLALRFWPWKRTQTLQRILDKNNGYFPGSWQAISLAARNNRLPS